MSDLDEGANGRLTFSVPVSSYNSNLHCVKHCHDSAVQYPICCNSRWCSYIERDADFKCSIPHFDSNSFGEIHSNFVVHN